MQQVCYDACQRGDQPPACEKVAVPVSSDAGSLLAEAPIGASGWFAALLVMCLSSSCFGLDQP
jgi:hypothetical protein